MLCYVMLCYHVMSAWVVYGLATWPCPKLEICRYVYSSHHWPLRWPPMMRGTAPCLYPLIQVFFYTQTHTQHFPADLQGSRRWPPRPWQSSKSEADVAESSGSIDQLRRALREAGGASAWACLTPDLG